MKKFLVLAILLVSFGAQARVAYLAGSLVGKADLISSQRVGSQLVATLQDGKQYIVALKADKYEIIAPFAAKVDKLGAGRLGL